MTVRMRIFCSYFLLITGALALTVFLSQGLVRNVFRESGLKSYRRELVYTTNRLQTRLDHVKDYQRTVALDTVVTDTFASYPRVLESEHDIYSMNRILRKRVTTIIGTNQEIYQYVFVTLEGTFLFFGDENAFQTSVGEVLGYDFFLENNAKRNLVLNGPYEMERVNGELLRFFVLSKQVVDLNTLAPLGYVAFILKEDFFSDIFEENMPFEIQVDFYLISKDMQVLSSSKKETVGSRLEDVENFSDQNLRQLQEKGICEIKGEEGTLLYTMTQMEDSEWSVVHVTSMDALLRNETMVLHIALVIGMITCAISLCIARLIAYRITEPIVKLSRKMTNYQAEDGKGDTLPCISRNEIYNLYFAFDCMVKKTDQLMQQIYVEQEEKSNYQFQLIQSQIKPHFLYNTLEMIKSLVDCKMYEEAGRAIMAMSRFYRLSLNSGNDITTVAQEMELSQQYLYIQRLRYAEYMDYTIMECEGMDQYAIPKLTLQPLLENAIYHGIKEKQENGKIELTIREIENGLVFIIEDNGAGMTSEELKKLRDALKDPQKKKEDSFGLYSINRRLHLFFGVEYELEIESEQFVFTRVTVQIPKVSLHDFQETLPF